MARIGWLGDSLTKATDYGGVTAANRFAYLISREAGYAPADIIVAGVSGNNSADGLSRLQSDIIAQNVNVCVVMFGNNDWGGLGKILTPSAYKNNMAAIFTRLREAGIKPVSISPMMGRGDSNSFASMEQYLVALEEVVATMGIPYIDLYRDYCYTVTKGTYLPLYVDAVHQSVAGNRYIATYAARPKFAGFFDPLPAEPVPPVVNLQKNLTLAIAKFIVDGQQSGDFTALVAARNALIAAG
ncbi:hypothetical protein D3C76_163700 [compost metagenome]